jgi:hypothetical protein
MTKEVSGYCPVCGEKLSATRLTCHSCKLDLTGDFSLSRFSYLNKEEQAFILLFLAYEGSFRDMQAKLNISYPRVKATLSGILVKLGLKEAEKNDAAVKKSEKSGMEAISEGDHFVVRRIKEKLNSCGGSATIFLLSGKQARIWYSADGSGIECDKIPIPGQLVWQVFVEAYNIAAAQDGEVLKGNARAGKLGSDKLPVDSLEGFVAYRVHGVREGESAFGPGFVIAAVLDWAGVSANERGKIVLDTEFALVKTYGEALKNAGTFLEGTKASQPMRERLSSFSHWYYFPELDAFAPSKFIGYRDMDLSTYMRFYNQGMHGGKTEQALSKLFDPAAGAELDGLRGRLEAQTAACGRRPKDGCLIHVKKKA